MCSAPLSRTQVSSEIASDGKLSFLDLTLDCNFGLCWSYGKTNPKPVLPASSSHSKLVKFGVVTSLLKNAMKKSCVHCVANSLRKQFFRLCQAGYDRNLIASRALRILLNEACSTAQRSRDFDNVVVVPYYHTVSHNILAVAKHFGIKVVFSNVMRLKSLTPFFTDEPSCTVNHKRLFVPCRKNVVYSIPLECGFVYVGQTGRCVNDRLREHATAVERGGRCSELVTHLQECHGCNPIFSGTRILAVERLLHRRLLKESLEIGHRGNVVSNPSLFPPHPLRRFLGI